MRDEQAGGGLTRKAEVVEPLEVVLRAHSLAAPAVRRRPEKAGTTEAEREVAGARAAEGAAAATARAE
eukprot:SM001457S01081  [mRNA]  locus=s1457:1441:2077:+ [translate_table: standard]